MDDRLYHIGFGRADLLALGSDLPTLVLLSGDPDRSAHIANDHLQEAHVLSTNRGLHSYLAKLPNGRSVICATSGMGGPSASIVVNELAQVGVKTIIRIGTTGSIQSSVRAGSVVISSGALSRHGAALDIAPVEFPAVADPFLTVMLAEAAQEIGTTAHVGITASVDTFFEGQERTESSANPHLQRWLQGITDEYRDLGILNYEMEAATLFKQCSVYGISAGCICAVIAQRTASELIVADQKEAAIEAAINVALAAAARWSTSG